MSKRVYAPLALAVFTVIGLPNGNARADGRTNLAKNLFTHGSSTPPASTTAPIVIPPQDKNMNAHHFGAGAGTFGGHFGPESVPEPAFYQMTALLTLGGFGVLRRCCKKARK